MTDFDTASLVLPVPEHWPVPPKKPAFHGLAGDLAMAAEPYTEADPVAILVQFLVAFGNVVGRGPHRSNEFAVIVGTCRPGRRVGRPAGYAGVFLARAAADRDRRIDPGRADQSGQPGGVRRPVQ